MLKKHHFLLFLISLWALSCTTSTPGVSLKIENFLDRPRTDVPFLMVLDSSIFNQYQPGLVPMLKSPEGELVPCQADDLNLDGQADVLAFQYSLDPKEKVKLSLEWVIPKGIITYPQRAHARLGYSPNRDEKYKTVTEHERPQDHLPNSKPLLYQFEGVGWENDKIAFRNYFDSRNGKDIFGKQYSRMMLDSIGLPGSDYHKLSKWGMDVLKVGNSLGAGALALFVNDSVYRLGATEKAHYQLISDGPVRAIFRLKYEGWQVEGKSYELEEEITIWAGTHYYESKVRLSPLVKNERIIVGLVNLKNTGSALHKIIEDRFTLGTWSSQSENGDLLGMAISSPRSQFDGISQPDSAVARGGVTGTYLLKLKPEISNEISFYFFANWELGAAGVSSKEEFWKLIQTELEERSKGITLSLSH